MIKSRKVTSKPTRNGCRTCRLRKVKCDEARPACSRCVSTGRTCDGEIGRSSVVLTKRNLLPSGSKLVFNAGDATPLSSSQESSSASSSPANLSRLPRRLSTWHSISTDLSDHERFGLQHFHELTGPALTAILPSPQWVQLAKQISVQEPVVLYAITATGTMARGLTVLMHPMYARPVDMELEVEAMWQHSKAIRSLREYIDRAVFKPAASTEPILLACLLCVCFEIFRGRNTAALQHARLGWRIAKDCQKGLLLESSPSASFFRSICEENIDASILFLDKERHHHDCCQAGLSAFPESFESADEAAHYLTAIAQAGEHLRYEFLELAKAHDAIRHAELFDLSQGAHMCLSACLSRTFPISAKQELRLDYLRQAHVRWDSTYKKYEQTLVPEEIRKEHLVLRIQYFYSNFALATCRDTREILTDRFLSDFRHTLDLVERYLDIVRPRSSGQRAPSFPLGSSFYGTSILPCLGLIAHKCRDQQHRQRALNLLLTANKREGLEDSGSSGYYATAVAELEQQTHIAATPEVTVQNEVLVPPEWARFCDVVTVGAGARGIFKLICARYVQHDGEETQIEVGEYEGGAVPLHQVRTQRLDIRYTRDRAPEVKVSH